MKNHLCNMITSIRNGQLAKKTYIYLVKTSLCEAVLNVLWDEGFIYGYRIEKNFLKIFLKYKNNIPVVNSIKTISKPSLRVYSSARQLCRLEGVIIISTSKGVLSLKDCKKENLGGELLLVVK